jgi:phage tail sheath protein FI
LPEKARAVFGSTADCAVYGPDVIGNSMGERYGAAATVAGMIARTDSLRGVWTTPAGIDATVHGINGLSVELGDDATQMLEDAGINALRTIGGRGPVVWGARTRAGSSEYRYVPVRRTALFIERSLYGSLDWVVFEPNDEPLWAKIRAAIGGFMEHLFRQGAFQGEKPSDAWFVRCDRTTMTQPDIDNGRLIALVGFAPVRPAEFVVLRISHKTMQSK